MDAPHFAKCVADLTNGGVCGVLVKLGRGCLLPVAFEVIE